MTRLFLLIALLFAFAAPALADTTTTTTPKKKPAVTRQVKQQAKHHVKRWTTPPGVRTPEQIERQQYNAWRRDRGFAYRYNVPRAYFYYYGEPTYNGRFGANRRDTLRAGPCWTQTPIGAVWNCGQ